MISHEHCRNGIAFVSGNPLDVYVPYTEQDEEPTALKSWVSKGVENGAIELDETEWTDADEFLPSNAGLYVFSVDSWELNEI